MSPEAEALLQRWLTTLSARRGRAENTLAAYRHDAADWLGFLGRHRGEAVTARLPLFYDVIEGGVG